MAYSKSALHRSRDLRRRSPTGLAPPRAGLLAAGAAALVAGLGGCAYRIDVQQGNVVEEDAVQQVEEGMTRSQVQFLLGTPLVSDPFHADRWDYTYYLRRGRERDVTRRWVSVYFDGDRVERVEQRVQPPESGALERELASRSDD